MSSHKILGMIAALFILIIASTAFAAVCEITVPSVTTEVRADNDTQFDSSITTENNTSIDVRIEFDIDSITGSDCPANIAVQPIVYRYNSNTNDWETYRSLAKKTQELGEESYSFTWSNEFSTGNDSKYKSFKVEGRVLNGTEILEYGEATVSVEDETCTGINIIASNITIDEGSTNTKTFRIENNTGAGFDISNIDLVFTNSLIRSGSVDYDNFIPAHSSRTVTMTIDTGFVSTSAVTIGKIYVSGELPNNSCSSSDIGVESFDVTIRNTTNNDNYDDYYDGYYDSYSTSSDCGALELQTNNVSINENTTQQEIFGLRNNSTKRFEILEVQTTSNGVQLSNLTNDQYIYPGQVGTIAVSATAPNVSTNKDYQNSVKVRGKFADGKMCTLSDLNSTFTTTVVDISSSGFKTNCSGFSLSAPQTVTIDNFGTVNLTISNQTNKRADIYVEGSADATPTIISMPSNTSINRGISVSTPQKSAYITLRPVVEGCNLDMTTVEITNTSKTAIATAGTGTSDNQNGATGLFALGSLGTSLGIILLIIIVAVLIAGIIIAHNNARGQSEANQKWLK